MAAYFSFHRYPARWRLWAAVLPMVMAALIHPMVAPLALVLAGHAMRFHGNWLRAHRGTVMAQAAVALLLAAPWLVSLASSRFGTNACRSCLPCR